jgi:hypothetical protein
MLFIPPHHNVGGYYKCEVIFVQLLNHNATRQSFGNPVQSHEWGVADSLCNILIYPGHFRSFPLKPLFWHIAPAGLPNLAVWQWDLRIRRSKMGWHTREGRYRVAIISLNQPCVYRRNLFSNLLLRPDSHCPPGHRSLVPEYKLNFARGLDDKQNEL